ncbi:MAG: hypothetical protein V8R80_05605 [Eubacterium sp.]
MGMLFPEAVYTITSATFEKKKKKKYETVFGTFTYRDVPSDAFPLEIRLVQEGEYFYRIAEPEKALCDTLYIMPPAKNTTELASLLFDDLRIDDSELLKNGYRKNTIPFRQVSCDKHNKACNAFEED